MPSRSAGLPRGRTGAPVVGHGRSGCVERKKGIIKRGMRSDRRTPKGVPPSASVASPTTQSHRASPVCVERTFRLRATPRRGQERCGCDPGWPVTPDGPPSPPSNVPFAWKALRPCVCVQERLVRWNVLPPLETHGEASASPVCSIAQSHVLPGACDRTRGELCGLGVNSPSERCALASVSVNVPCDGTVDTRLRRVTSSACFGDARLVG